MDRANGEDMYSFFQKVALSQLSPKEKEAEVRSAISFIKTRESPGVNG